MIDPHHMPASGGSRFPGGSKVKPFGVRSGVIRQAFALALLASLGLGCRKVTAEPSAGIPKGPFEISETIFDGGLKPGWQDYGWGAHDLAHGAARIGLSGYGGWILHHDPLTERYGAFVFRMQAPSSFGNFLRIQLANGQGDKSFPDIDVGPDRVRAVSGGWLEGYVAWSDLNPSAAPFDRIVLHAKSELAADTVQFDKLGFTRPTKIDKAAAAASNKRVKLVVNCRAPGTAISPYIYGIAGDTWDVEPSIRRWGGNPTTRYNWQLGNAWNVGKDWYFENQKSPTYQMFLSGNASHHVASALTVPMIGWVSKDTVSVGFPSSVYGPQHAHDPYRPEVGDGVRADGTLIHPKDATQTSVAAPPEMIQKWIAAIRQEDQKSGAKSVHMYILDNEPNLWSANHRDVHPDALTYDELLDRTLRYSSVIRTTDPQAAIAGPAEWGWTGYLYSAQDALVGVSSRPDRRAHGDEPLISWYLKKLHEHDVAAHTKSIDVLDLHYYPQENGVYGDAADAATAALRLRSTRSLWDPNYKDESWIKDTIRLIPRMKEWVQQNYPGLAISIGEYNFGAEKHMSGALAEAEALGRFGTQGVNYAFYWLAPPKNSPVYWAFRAYRNFDGKGGRFLDQSVPTQMDPSVSLFASKDATGKHLVLIALNLEPSSAAQAKIELAGCAPIATHQRFTYSPEAPAPTAEGVVAGGALDERLPPYSINVFDIALK